MFVQGSLSPCHKSSCVQFNANVCLCAGDVLNVFTRVRVNVVYLPNNSPQRVEASSHYNQVLSPVEVMDGDDLCWRNRPVGGRPDSGPLGRAGHSQTMCLRFSGLNIALKFNVKIKASKSVNVRKQSHDFKYTVETVSYYSADSIFEAGWCVELFYFSYLSVHSNAFMVSMWKKNWTKH